MVHSEFRTLYDVTGRINDINTVLVQRQEFDGLTKAARQALEALIWTTGSGDFGPGGIAHEGAEKCLYPAITSLREALEEAPQPAAVEQEHATLLPDGSAFAVVSYPLPKTHWLYAPREYEDGADKPKELPAPILTHAQRDSVIAAIRYAVRGATMCGKEMDFDPDALVQNAVYALCGPYARAEAGPETGPAVAIEHIETALNKLRVLASLQPLTDAQIQDIWCSAKIEGNQHGPFWFARAIERAHGIGGEA